MPSDLDKNQVVTQWLDSDKFPNLTVDDDLFTSAQAQIFARLSRGYDVSQWGPQAKTPELVWIATGMLVAAWIYDRAYSETTEEENKYSLKLESQAEDIVAGIEEGAINMNDYQATLPTGTGPGDMPDQPSFYPRDKDNASPVYDSMGRQVADEGSEDIIFSMGMKF